MTPPAKRTRLRHVPVRITVAVDPKEWAKGHPGVDLPEEVRRHVVEVVKASDPAIVNARRDGL